jgi:predicted tellurium resistance membrane protein TerC
MAGRQGSLLLTPVRRHGKGEELVTDRTIIAVLGGLVCGLVALIGADMIVQAYDHIGWQVPLAVGIAVTGSLWIVDWLSDYLERRRK